MNRVSMILVIVGLAAAPAAAQGRRNNAGIPPGQMPRAGECRVWYDGVPPGQQPAPMNCDDAERIASRSRTARVIYGSDRYDQWGTTQDSRRRDGRPVTGRAVPRDQYPGTYYPDARYPSQQYGYGSEAYRSGYNDGVAKGQEDTRDGDRYDPARHGWYKSANRGYNSRYGSKEEYAEAYRDGFLEGYRGTYRRR
jgi:hypothetical protein